MKKRNNTFMNNIMPWIYLISIVVALVFLLLYCSLFFHYDRSEIKVYYFVGFFTVTALFAATALYAGKRAYNNNRESFWFVNVIFFAPVFLILLFGEIWSRMNMPPWPANALHGVDPSIGKTEWGRIQSLYPDALGNNSWGQRDRERTIVPKPGKTRFTFIGDSFLEESSFLPVSMIVESKLDNSIEVINLGVSTNDPPDYYWTVKNVALKMGTQHVFVFFFMGNDVLLIKPPIYRIIREGILNYPPRDSLLGNVVPGLSFYIMNKYRRSMSWVYSKRHHYEQSTLKQFQSVGIEELPGDLLKYCPRNNNCLKKLKGKDLRAFYKNLTNPDLGLFRSFALRTAVCNYCDSEPVRKETLNKHQVEMLEYTVNIMALMKKTSEDENVDFTIVIVPQGFEVDDRLWEQWKVLNDFRTTLHYIVLQAEYLKKAFDKLGIDYVDLYPVFQGTRGTYLNFDGHWSEAGNELAANTVAEYIKNRYSIDSR